MTRVADYEFSGTPNTQSAIDSSKGGHHGSLEGGAHLDGLGNAAFHGSDHVFIEPDTHFGLSEGTVIIEFTQASASTGRVPWGENAAQTLFSVDATGSTGGGHLTIYLRSDGSVCVRHQTETGDHFLYGGSIKPGVPASIGYSWGPELSTLVVNGRPVAWDKAALGLAGNNLPIVIGASQAESTHGTTDGLTGYFDGTISRVQIHDKALRTSKPVPCFAAGTLIATPRGEVAVETLRVGDIVLTADHGPQQLRRITRQMFRAADLAVRPRLCPILIEKDVLGNHRALVVSRQHALLIPRQDVLVRAIHLARHAGDGFRILNGCRRIDYHHLLFDRHEIVFANGAPAESLLPEWGAQSPMVAPPAPVRPILSGRQARDLLQHPGSTDMRRTGRMAEAATRTACR